MTTGSAAIRFLKTHFEISVSPRLGPGTEKPLQARLVLCGRWGGKREEVDLLPRGYLVESIFGTDKATIL